MQYHEGLQKPSWFEASAQKQPAGMVPQEDELLGCEVESYKSKFIHLEGKDRNRTINYIQILCKHPEDETMNLEKPSLLLVDKRMGIGPEEQDR